MLMVEMGSVMYCWTVTHRLIVILDFVIKLSSVAFRSVVSYDALFWLPGHKTQVMGTG